jgi:DNA-binding MarR family transcriptional regulator
VTGSILRPSRLNKGKTVAAADASEARLPSPDAAGEFADAVLALLAVALRTRGRLQPLFEDVTVPQLVLLDAVQTCGGEGVAAISAYTLLSQPTVTQQTAVLEDAGLIERVPAEDDRRRRILTLTTRGEELLTAKRAVVADRFAVAWDVLSPEERAIAVPLLRHLADVVSHLA